jgi:hypothetical protein
VAHEPDPDEAPRPAPRRIPRPAPGHLDVPGIIESFAENMMYAVAKDEFTAAELDIYHAVAYAVRDRLMERWFLTQDAYYRSDAKRVYYLSMEFLPGRLLLNNILNLGAHPAYARAIEKLGYALTNVAEREVDPGLGNGGLRSSATASATSTASSASASRTGSRSRPPTTGCATGTPGRSRGPTPSSRSSSTGGRSRSATRRAT